MPRFLDITISYQGLDGVVFPMRMTDLSLLAYNDEPGPLAREVPQTRKASTRCSSTSSSAGRGARAGSAAKMAKTHVRHVVGGHPSWTKSAASNELLYRFEFPERSGVLMRFLDSMRSDWNISLFHYRNHGAV